MTLASFCFGALAAASQATAISWQQPSGLPPYGTFFGLPGLNATYDYVIVGGGTAGLTVASRLAENSSLSIAVVEAGTFSEISNGNNSQVPAYSVKGIGSGEYKNPFADWELDTVEQPVCYLNPLEQLFAWHSKLTGNSNWKTEPSRTLRAKVSVAVASGTR